MSVEFCRDCDGSGFGVDHIFCGSCGATGVTAVPFRVQNPMLDAMTDALFKLGTSLRGSGMMKQQIVTHDFDHVIDTFMDLAEGGCDGLVKEIAAVPPRNGDGGDAPAVRPVRPVSAPDA